MVLKNKGVEILSLAGLIPHFRTCPDIYPKEGEAAIKSWFDANMGTEFEESIWFYEYTGQIWLS